MLDRFTGLQVFSRVATLGSLSAAARDLGMSQTMATKHIAAIEERLGARMLHRTTRRVSLTEAGRVYLDAAERILGELSEADGRAAAATIEVTGTLRLNVPVSFGIREIAPLLPELARRHPELSIDLGLNDRRVDLVEEGWDLVIRISSAMKSSSLIARRLASCGTVLCASPSYLAARGRPERTIDLVNHACLGYTLSETLGASRWAFGKDGRHAVDVHCVLKANNGDALVAAAVAGHGIVYQPTFLVRREIANGQLMPIALDHPTRDLAGVFAVFPTTRLPPAKVRATIDFLAEKLGPVPPWER